MSDNHLPERILSISPEVTVSAQSDGLRLQGPPGKSIHLEFASGRAYLLRKEAAGWFVLPSDPEHASLHGDTLVWVLPLRVDDPAPAWLVRATPGSPLTVQVGQTVAVHVEAESVEIVRFENRPRADLFGRRFHLRIESGETLEQALAAFYWDTIQPCVVERTCAATYPTPDGYVLSTLAANYGGTYPDVDHEFQIKGRLAAGSALDQDVCRRMLELQFRLMREDPEGLWRNPCAIQPDGSREYHVRRSSLDGSTTATMFLITGNVEVLEETWLYTTATQDRDWLAAHILDLEGAASEIEAWVDSQGRLWSDVYFEDQVMQDGRVCDAQAFAAHGLRRLAELEAYLGREKQAVAYLARSNQLSRALVKPFPEGFWNPKTQSFCNWIDRQEKAHDHTHLLSNELPALFQFTSPEQTQAILNLVDMNLAEFQRFPSFVALDLSGYTVDEIGDGGPYDLCAAGRYWCWDAAFWAWRKNSAMLLRQLLQVAQEARRDDYRMGERYDMDHVYYIDGHNWHGSAHYYEYPCVFTWVLAHEYLGLKFALGVDLLVAPCLQGWGSVEFREVAYTCTAKSFTLTNRSNEPKIFNVDLSALYPHTKKYRVRIGNGERRFANGDRVHLLPGQTCEIKPVTTRGNPHNPD